MISLRPYRTSDSTALLALFVDTVHQVNSGDYSPEQVAAWAPDDLDPVAWAARFRGRFVLIADCHGQLAGFADLEAGGHIDRFFVAADQQRAGVGRHLLDALVQEAHDRRLARLYTEASISARRFFERFGFVTLATRDVVLRGVVLRNFEMERELV